MCSNSAGFHEDNVVKSGSAGLSGVPERTVQGVRVSSVHLSILFWLWWSKICTQNGIWEKWKHGPKPVVPWWFNFDPHTLLMVRQLLRSHLARCHASGPKSQLFRFALGLESSCPQLDGSKSPDFCTSGCVDPFMSQPQVQWRAWSGRLGVSS